MYYQAMTADDIMIKVPKEQKNTLMQIMLTDSTTVLGFSVSINKMSLTIRLPETNNITRVSFLKICDITIIDAEFEEMKIEHALFRPSNRYATKHFVVNCKMALYADWEYFDVIRHSKSFGVSIPVVGISVCWDTSLRDYAEEIALRSIVNHKTADKNVQGSITGLMSSSHYIGTDHEEQDSSIEMEGKKWDLIYIYNKNSKSAVYINVQKLMIPIGILKTISQKVIVFGDIIPSRLGPNCSDFSYSMKARYIIVQ